MKTIALISLQALILCAAPQSFAAPGDLDLSFDPGSRINGGINSIVPTPDGKILIGGNFTTVSGATRGGLARLNADGTTDLNFLNGEQGAEGWTSVNAVAVQRDGKILVAGGFTRFNGMPRSHITRLDPDGLLDLSFTSEISGGDYPLANCLVIQNDGKILIGGLFSTVNGVARTNVARLNEDGSLDETFIAGAQAVSGEWGVNALVIESDGRILAGGSFSSVNGVQQTNLARLLHDGSLDTSFAPRLDQSEWSTVRAIALQAEGKILVGGGFDGFDRHSSDLVRLNFDGSRDDAFTADVAGPFNGVRSVGVQCDGRILIAGDFEEVNGKARRYLARLNQNGSTDETFLHGLVGPDNELWTMALEPAGGILIGSNFGFVNGTERTCIARLNADGTLENAFSNPPGGPSTYIMCLALQPAVPGASQAGQLVIGGLFNSVNGLSRRGVARINGDGSVDPVFAADPAVGSEVFCLAVQQDGKVLLGGYAALQRLNEEGSLDNSFHAPLNSGDPAPYVRSLAIQPDGKILVAGTFSSVSGGTNWHLCRLNTDGSWDPSFLAGMEGPDNSVTKVIVQPDGKILVRGHFFFFNGVIVRTGFCRLNPDGSLDTSFLYPGYASPLDFILQDSGRIIAAGYLEMGPGIYGIKRLNPDGSVDNSFSNGVVRINNPGPLTMAEQPDGKILVAGIFDQLNGLPCGRITRLNPNGSLDTAFGAGQSGANDDIRALAISGDGLVAVGGLFSTMNQVPRRYLARLFTDSDQSPVILGSPTSQMRDVGKTAHFQVRAIGTPQVHYTWLFNQTNQVQTSTTCDLYLPAVQLGDAGAYSVVAANSYGTVTSAPAQLRVLCSPPAIREAPRSQMITLGQFADFYVGAAGALPLRYEWCLNGNPLAGQTNPILRLAHARVADAGDYTVQVRNDFGMTSSAPARLSILAPRSMLAAVQVSAEPGLPVDLDYTSSPADLQNWSHCATLTLTNPPQLWCDYSSLVIAQRFYRASVAGPGAAPKLAALMAPVVTLSGPVGSSVRIEYRNAVSPPDQWLVLTSLTLTNTSQMLLDVSGVGQPPRLYRLAPSP